MFTNQDFTQYVGEIEPAVKQKIPYVEYVPG